ncbi:MAG: hypothetical protein S4CHLAM2_17100 [Chlamydiales bacterium]|nr:hypothetical protein [Chlamydiales bacterium]
MRFILFFFLCSSLTASVLEIQHFSEVPTHIKADTLLILDIDDTLMVPTQMLGCDEWFQERMRHHLSQGKPGGEALERSLAEWEAVRHLTDMRLCEPTTHTIVHKLQENGTTVMGLTTQGLALATRTRQQLLDLDIDLMTTAPSRQDYYFTLADHGILYRHGILFTSGRAKGQALFYLLDHLKIEPKHIIFVNDKASHINDVKGVADARGVEFVGLRYAYSDQPKKLFSPEVAHYQFTHSTLTHFLSDEAAKAQCSTASPSR